MIILSILLVLSVIVNVLLIRKASNLESDVSWLEFERFVSKINSELDRNDPVVYNSNEDNSKGVLQWKNQQ